MTEEEETVHAFQVGDLVEWASKGGRYTTKKRGRVLMVLQPGDAIDKIAGAIWRINDGLREDIWPLAQKGKPSEYNWAPLCDGISPRLSVTYIVKVPSQTGRGKAKLYRPRTSQLRLVPQ